METKKVLLVLNDITPEELQHVHDGITQTCRSSDVELQIELHLVYVSTPIPAYYLHLPSFVQCSYETLVSESQYLREAGAALQIPIERQWCVTGHLRHATYALAENNGCHFILSGAAIHRQLKPWLSNKHTPALKSLSFPPT